MKPVKLITSHSSHSKCSVFVFPLLLAPPVKPHPPAVKTFCLGGRANEKKDGVKQFVYHTDALRGCIKAYCDANKDYFQS